MIGRRYLVAGVVSVVALTAGAVAWVGTRPRPKPGG